MTGINYIIRNYRFERENGEVVEVAGVNPRDARERFRRMYKEEPARTLKD